MNTIISLYQLAKAIWQDWKFFKSVVAKLYPIPPRHEFYIGLEIVEPKFNRRPVILTDGREWRGHYCVRKVYRYETIDDFKSFGMVWPSRFPVLKAVKTFAIPTVGTPTKTPHLHLVA